ncbi:MAG: hypothetical protein AAF197_12370, partial [Pseudomonadota bacterium]
QLGNGKAAQIKFDTLQDRVFAGEVVEIGSGQGGGGSSFPVTVALTESDAAIRTGLAASVSFALAQTSGDNEDFVLPL